MKSYLFLILTVLTLLLSACTLVDAPTDETNGTDPVPPVNEEDTPSDEDDTPADVEDETHGVDSTYLDIYHTNDVHGTIEADGPTSLGLGRMANLMRTKKEENPNNTLILDGGDALQGSALSNYYEGESYIELMNAIGYDAMVVGNHEFDWGLETITRYFDDTHEKGIADFPLLGANIIEDSTGELPKHIDPYTLVERAGRTIGIIGTIGYGLESSIAPSRVEGYSFLDPLPIIETHAKTLRTEENAELVLLLTHDSGSINSEVLAFEGEAAIDAIFNGHSHGTRANVLDGKATLISGGYGSNVGSVHFSWYNGSREVSAKLHHYYSEPLLQESHKDVQSLIDGYTDETDAIFKAPIIDTATAYSRSELSEWIADLMRHATGADIGFQNFGGTRTALDEGTVTLADLYAIWPFENQIKTVELDGATVNELRHNLIDAPTESQFINGEMYMIATNDYVFDQDYHPFLDGGNPQATNYYIRDIAEEELKLQSEVYDQFDMGNPFLFTQD